MVIDPARPFDLEYTPDEGQDGMRLDRYVRFAVPTISRTRIQKYNRDGRITVNGTVRPDNWKVRAGDRVVLRCRVPEGGADVAKNIPVHVLYEDEYLLAVNKQAGLVVHPVALHRHDTLMNALYWRYRDFLPDHKELSLVNRIDKFTSGVVLVSKDPEAKRDLQRQFEARTVSKTYLAIASGELENESGGIDLPVGPKKNRVNRVLMGIRNDEEGRPAQTSYRVLERFDGFTLVHLAPRTGRQHQLRVHLAALGHSLAADHLYGDNRGYAWKEEDGAEGRFSRFALHASTIRFRHPLHGHPLCVTAPPAPDFAAFAEILRKRNAFSSFDLDIAGSSESGDDLPAEQDRKESVFPYGNHEFDHL